VIGGASDEYKKRGADARAAAAKNKKKTGITVKQGTVTRGSNFNIQTSSGMRHIQTFGKGKSDSGEPIKQSITAAPTQLSVTNPSYDSYGKLKNPTDPLTNPMAPTVANAAAANVPNMSTAGGPAYASPPTTPAPTTSPLLNSDPASSTPAGEVTPNPFTNPAPNMSTAGGPARDFIVQTPDGGYADTMTFVDMMDIVMTNFSKTKIGKKILGENFNPNLDNPGVDPVTGEPVTNLQSMGIGPGGMGSPFNPKQARQLNAIVKAQLERRGKIIGETINRADLEGKLEGLSVVGQYVDESFTMAKYGTPSVEANTKTTATALMWAKKNWDKVFLSIAAATGSIGIGLWAKAETIEPLNMLQLAELYDYADETGDWSLVDQAEAGKRALNDYNFVEKFGTWTPASIFIHASRKAEGNIMGASIMEQLTKAKKEQQELGLTDDQAWESRRQAQIDMEQTISDNQSAAILRTQMITQANKEYADEKSSAFWLDHQRKIDALAAEERKKVADFWLEYDKKKAELELQKNNDSPYSSLSFGLLG